MQLIDHIFVLLIFVVLPIHSSIDTRRYLARINAGKPANRPRLYLETSAMQWIFLAVVAITWWILARPIDDLGFRILEGPQLWGGSAVLVALIGMMVYGWQTTKRASEEEKKKQVDALGKFVPFLPHTRRDFRYFVVVSITAGVVEEIVFRGFALLYLGWFMPLWVAVVVSSVGFGIVHMYLGGSGAIRAGILGLCFAIYYVLTGSIWLPILAHAALDILQGMIAVELLRKDENTSDGTPGQSEPSTF